jgi:hypothetical protein
LNSKGDVFFAVDVFGVQIQMLPAEGKGLEYNGSRYAAEFRKVDRKTLKELSEIV